MRGRAGALLTAGRSERQVDDGVAFGELRADSSAAGWGGANNEPLHNSIGILRRMSDSPSFGNFALRVTACHVVTYFVAGLGAFAFLDYRGQFLSQALSCFMLPVDAPIVALGPILQVFRGLIFAAALFPFRQVFLATPAAGCCYGD